MKSNRGRSAQGRNPEQGSGEAAIEEGGVDPVVEREGLNQQTAETQREGRDGETAQDQMNTGPRRLGREDGEPRRNPKKSDALGQQADPGPAPGGFQRVGVRKQDKSQGVMAA